MAKKPAYEELEQKINKLEKEISRIKQSEEKLKHDEENFWYIIENMPLGIHMYRLESDGQLRFTGTNLAADRILGIDNKQYIGKTIFEAFPNISETHIPSRFKEIAGKGGYWEKEEIIYEDDKISGTFQSYNFQILPDSMVSLFIDITDRKQAEVALQRAHDELEERVAERTEELERVNEELQNDITERKQAEETLKKSEEKYRTLFEAESDALFMVDAETGAILEANTAATDIYGYSIEELVNLKAMDLSAQPKETKRVIQTS